LNRSFTFALAAAFAVAFLLSGGVGEADAQQQDKDQQNCIKTMNKSGQKVLQTQGKENSKCVKDAGAGKLAISAQACLTADLKGKVSKATSKTGAGETKKCSVTPDFAFTGAATVNAAAVDQEIGLTADVFGDPLGAAIATEKTAAKCQASVVKTYEKLSATFVKTFNGCKKDVTKTGADDSTDVSACLGLDEKGKITKAEGKVGQAFTKKCPSLDQTVLFPQACATAASAAECADSLNARARCRACQAIAVMDDLADADCDTVDDGMVNGTCGRCGDGVVGLGEECDEGGATAKCSAECRVLGTCTTSAAACSTADDCPPGEGCCGNGVVEAVEECDELNLVDDDGCTSSCTICGNAVLTAPEECDDGDLESGDGCSGSCTCGVGSGEFGCVVSNVQDPLCPDRGQLLVLAAIGSTSCANNTDCSAVSGVCDTGLGRCISQTNLDSGWTGIAHGSDVVDQALAKAYLLCPGPAGPTCGLCAVTGIDPSSGNCRCAGDNRQTCDEPFANDADDCGGALCQCYFGPPLPLSSGNTPACVVNRVRREPIGTANVDTGEANVAVSLAAEVYLGIDLTTPCPSCGGTCTAPPAKVGNQCARDVDCDSALLSGDGVCGNYDTTPDDGLREGTCFKGTNGGQSCDVNGVSSTFPAPGGGGSSLDCFPDPGKNVSGTGLKIDLNSSTTASLSLSADIPCGFEGQPGAEYVCPCSVCDNDPLRGCSSNADCSDAGVCQDFFSNGVPLPNQCDNFDCSDLGGGQGECTTGPDGTFCDGIVRADGNGFISCLGNADCAPGTIGLAAGDCTLSERRKCFLDPITAQGVADPDRPVSAAVFCVAPTSNGGINTVAGLPGPGRVINEGVGTSFCASNPAVAYTPGVGGCP
jgi:cysteine-rich repeat protein